MKNNTLPKPANDNAGHQADPYVALRSLIDVLAKQAAHDFIASNDNEAPTS